MTGILLKGVLLPVSVIILERVCLCACVCTLYCVSISAYEMDGSGGKCMQVHISKKKKKKKKRLRVQQSGWWDLGASRQSILMPEKETDQICNLCLWTHEWNFHLPHSGVEFLPFVFFLGYFLIKYGILFTKFARVEFECMFSFVSLLFIS